MNQPNDIYEQEADAMAEKIIRVPSTNTFFKPGSNSVQRKSSQCEEEDRNLQLTSSPERNNATIAPATVNNTINSSGQSLDLATRKFMESRFGHDFANVQIHSDSLAHQSSKDINALAYTYGNHIIFRSGHYQPDTISGKKLLAHELTHVVQQASGNTQSIQRQPAGDVEEESARQGEKFREGRLKDLSKAIDLMKFKKIRVDCPKNTGVHLLDVLAEMRTSVSKNQKCVKFFKDKFNINPDIMFDPKRKPSITFDPGLKISGLTRCPEPSPDSPIPSVSIGNICTSPHLERVIMHELTHYAQCFVKWGQTSSEDVAEEGAVTCMGTVQEALEKAKKKKEQQK